VFLRGRTVIRKEPLGADAQRRLQHELAMLERLRSATGIAQLANAPPYPGSIVLVDVGGASAVELPKPLAIDDLIGLAVDMARAVAEMHRRGVMHRDIAPANIVVSGEGAPCLVDFALATPLAEVRPDFTHHSEIVGTLAYLAPEQTGRTGRSVDERADLYALGATLYELATGEPPFGSGDPLRLIHDHLARVPVPPAQVNPAVPAVVSEIVMRLLEKEPENRYQTADGLVHDLEAVRDAPAGAARAALRIGEQDFPLRLLPPSRLVGRDAQVATLREAFDEALEGRCRGVLISGAPGVGKTALAAEVRLVVASRGGWFVAGKFDEHRRDLEFDAAHQALRALGRVLLAEPERDLTPLRERILAAVGPNAGLLTAVVPEFAALLAVPPAAGDPLTAQARAAQSAVAVLRAVATPLRPVVVFVDDLQWAGRAPLGFVDGVLSGEPIEGLLLVGSYRDGDGDVDAAHPLAALLSRWRDQAGVRHIPLDNLSGPSQVEMVADMLHADPASAAGLVAAIEPHTRGNPYDTVEVLDALRRDGVLTATADGWQWDDGAARARLQRSEITELLGARIAGMPPRSQQMVEAMACLGGRAELSMLQAATGESADAVEQMLAPALEEGLLVVDPGVREARRFRHDRVREAVLDALGRRERRARQLAIARRLADAPELFAVAAEQYLPVVDEVEDPTERRRVVSLFRQAADQARLIGDYALVNALLTAALRLIDPADAVAVLEVRTGRHAALFSLGRLDEADEEYRSIAELCPAALDRADATAVQVRNLSHRTRFAEAIELGLESLRECGITVPAADGFSDGLDDKFARLHRWLDSTGPAEDLPRRELCDPALLAASSLIDAVLPLAYFVADPPMIAWLAMEAVRIWIEHGPSRLLIGSAAHAAYQAGPQRDDYPAAYLALGRIVALGEAHGYEPGTSQARYMAATMAGWFEPIETGVRAAHQARDGLIAGGELTYGGYSYQLSVPYSMDCAPSLASFVTEIEEGFAFLRRTGNEQTGRWLDSYGWLVRVLRSESSTAASEAVPLDRYAGDPTALIYAHLCRAIAAAIFGDRAGLAQHSAAAMELLQAVHGFYAVAQVRVLRGLALAEEARATDGGARGDLLAQLDELARWMAGWAAHAPDNFLHQLRLIEAERAWAAGDFRAAVIAFDAARREVAGRQRPWHRALIAERAGRFFLAHGVEHVGYDLLAHARHDYLTWGATAKVDQIDWAHPPLQQHAGATTAAGGAEQGDLAHHRSTVTAGTIDLLGILAASQALSSETSIGGLHARVAEVLGAMTGATGVHLLLWSDERQDWLLPVSDCGATTPVTGTGAEHAVPMSVLRYLQRTREPLIVADATGDDRFARDPYFADVGACSLLAVPIVSRGTLTALLVLENRLIRGAFSTERLDAVKLIAGQLAVSLDNAQMYADYRRIADEQAALRRVATLVAEGPPPTAVFDAVATEIQRLLDADGVTLGRFEPGDEVTVVAHRGWEGWHLPAGTRFSHEGKSVTAEVRRIRRPSRMEQFDAAEGSIAEYVRDQGVRSSVGAPIIVEGRLWGIAVVYWTREESPPADTEERIGQFAKLLETAIANADSREQLLASRARLLVAGDEARRRVVRDLHDGAQQRLVHAIVSLKFAQRALQDNDAEAPSLVGDALDAVEQGNKELRELARGILPTILTRGGLRPAVSAIVKRLDVPIDVDILDERFPAEIEASAYFIVAEALTNIVKHADATRAKVMTSMEQGMLRVEVRDDGIGGADPRSHGLVGMSDRVAALQGRLELESPPGVGTTVVATLPISTG
jgi:signal transduction histidine kinase/tRNA A-37 threonylcarbamoyl transferase component Bud32